MNKIAIAFPILIFLLFASCCKEYPIPDFTNEELSWMPYKDGDTLKMKGKNGKQLWLRFSNMRESTGKVNKNPGSFEPQCPVGAERGRTISVTNVSKGGKDTLIFESKIGGFEFTINKQQPGSLLAYISSPNYFDSRKAKKIDTIINGSNLHFYKDTSTQYSSYPKNPTAIFSELYIMPGIGISRINFKNFKDADYETY